MARPMPEAAPVTSTRRSFKRIGISSGFCLFVTRRPSPKSREPGQEGACMRVGIEVGGTFTDLVAVQGDQILVAKVPSTPKSPDIGAFASLAAAALSLPEITDLAHGSTVATNAVLERKGARIAFVTTKGFRDILALQRHDRRRIYDLNYQKPKPVVERRDCFEVLERITHDGAVLIRLDEGGVGRELIPALRDGQYDAVAVCLLGSYANPAHEQRLAQLIADALPGLLVTC